ncbi:hypothetical protein CHARACLAT_020868 [Characodon lateralis]|uniref:Uncharacterized protein n=1 Tax=Characodon lateralis TaxID=208331 RepID=A0ABU7DU94_9TELE|nr:hypothetical protein [Characodon lateralis]
MIKTIYALWISYPISCLRLDLHQAGSFLLLPSPGPSRNGTLSTLQRKHLTPDSLLSAPSSHISAPRKPSTDSPSLNLDPESLYPWRPDHSYL